MFLWCNQAALATAAGVGVSPVGSALKPTISLPVVQSVSGFSSSYNLHVLHAYSLLLASLPSFLLFVYMTFAS